MLSLIICVEILLLLWRNVICFVLFFFNCATFSYNIYWTFLNCFKFYLKNDDKTATTHKVTCIKPSYPHRNVHLSHWWQRPYTLDKSYKKAFCKLISVCQGQLFVLFCLSANTHVCTKWWPSVLLLRNIANDRLAANSYWLAWDIRLSWQTTACLVNTFGVLHEISMAVE